MDLQDKLVKEQKDEESLQKELVLAAKTMALFSLHISGLAANYHSHEVEDHNMGLELFEKVVFDHQGFRGLSTSKKAFEKWR